MRMFKWFAGLILAWMVGGLPPVGPWVVAG
jgi:hypothetical protein